jgi:hypothetical protein
MLGVCRKMKNLLIILALASLACGATLPAQNNPKEYTATVNSMPTESVRMVVSGLYPDEPLNIRTGAGGTETGEYLHNGDVVILYQSVMRGDTLWCAIDAMYTRWVACRYLKGQ